MVRAPATSIEVRGVHRNFGSVHALHDVTFTVHRREIVGLLGPNGAGKTTLLRVLTGTLAPTAGAASIGGHDVLLEPLVARRHLGWLPEGAPAYPEMSVEGYLGFVGRARGLGASARAVAVDRVCETCDLDEHRKRLVGVLSRGYRQRVGLAQALLHEPPVLLLDEPTTGLDPNQRAELRTLIRTIGETRTVLLSTHVLSEVRAVCDRVVILHQGRVVADDSTARITAAAHGTACVVGFGPSKVVISPGELDLQLRAVPGVTEVRALAADRARFEVHADHDVRADLFAWAVEHGHTLVELTEQQRSLEQVFRSLTEAT